jgi:outer membrane protein assembly factor BamD (BamD/ComL family)
VVAVESRAAEPALEAGSPLATEVAYVDRARALLAAGQSSQGLALLEHYEQKFREARLLPEVLFLQLEAYQRAGRSAEARNAAQRLVDGFPKSPHAGRARKLLEH